MAAASDDDVPEVASKTGHGDSRARDAAGFGPPAPAGPASNTPRVPEPTPDSMDDSVITATAPMLRATLPRPSLPIAIPGAVKIIEIPSVEEPLEETEMKTVVTLAAEKRPASPAAGASLSDSSEADEPDDSVTTQAVSPLSRGPLTAEDEPKTSPPMLAPAPLPAAGRRPSDPLAFESAPERTRGDDYDGEESVTTRGPPVRDYEDDSVTTQGPVAVSASQIASNPALDESEDSTDNHTAVMLNAPTRPPEGGPSSSRALRSVLAARPLGGGRVAAIAEQHDPSSDSGLRIARPDAPSGDRASLDVILAGPGAQASHVESRGGRAHGFARQRIGDVNPYTKTEHAFLPSLRVRRNAFGIDFASLIQKRRYELIVGLVACVSFAVPLFVYVWLHSSEEAHPREKAAVAPDPVVREDQPRAKASGSASTKTPPSHSPQPSAPPPRRAADPSPPRRK